MSYEQTCGDCGQTISAAANYCPFCGEPTTREVRTDGGHVDRHGRRATDPDEFRATSDELSFFDDALALGYLRRLEVLLEACPIRIYAASSLKHPWPYRLQNAKECYPASFWRSPDRILDSAIAAPELTNGDVLRHALERHATSVVAKDYLPFDLYDDDQLENVPTEYRNHREATTASIREFIGLHDPDVHPPAYIPLQPPYDEHVAEVYPIVDESHLEHRYMLGGLAQGSPAERIDGLLAFRAEVGDEPVAHGLGWGLDDKLVATLRDEPALLDSVDNSSPSQAVQNDRILDKHWQAKPCQHVGGKYQNTVGGAFEFAMLVQATQRLTEYNTDLESVSSQRNLGEFGGVTADD